MLLKALNNASSPIRASIPVRTMRISPSPNNEGIGTSSNMMWSGRAHKPKITSLKSISVASFFSKHSTSLLFCLRLLTLKGISVNINFVGESNE